MWWLCFVKRPCLAMCRLFFTGGVPGPTCNLTWEAGTAALLDTFGYSSHLLLNL